VWRDAEADIGFEMGFGSYRPTADIPHRTSAPAKLLIYWPGCAVRNPCFMHVQGWEPENLHRCYNA